MKVSIYIYIYVEHNVIFPLVSCFKIVMQCLLLRRTDTNCKNLETQNFGITFESKRLNQLEN
jgi:hypothetical protein